MTKRRKPGRPPLGRDAASVTVRLRLSPADADRWERAAKLGETTLSQLIREAVEMHLRRLR